MSNDDMTIQEVTPTPAPRHRASVIGIVINLWEAAAAMAVGSLLALRSPAWDVGSIVAGALVIAITADLGTMTIVGRKLVDVRHVRGLGLVLVLGGALAAALRLSVSSGPAWRVMAVTVVCSILTGREALVGWGFGHDARRRRQVGRIIRHHNALMAETNGLPDDLRVEVLSGTFPAVWDVVCDAPHGLRNRLVEGDLS